MGLYTQALELFDEISSENVVYLGSEYLFMFAHIKHFQGEEREAISIMSKSIDISPDEETKALNMYRLLEMDLEIEGEDAREEKEQNLEEFLMNSEKKNVEHVYGFYVEYLRSRNEI